MNIYVLKLTMLQLGADKPTVMVCIGNDALVLERNVEGHNRTELQGPS